MRPIFTVVIFACVLTYNSAQSQTKFGIRGGLNISNQKLNGQAATTTFKSILRFHAGLFAESKLSDKLILQPEIIYNGIGSRLGENNNGYKMLVDYVCVPMLIKYNLKGATIGTGPQAGLLMGAKVKAGDDEENSKSMYKSFDLGWLLNVDVPVTRSISIAARYHLGLTNIYKDLGSQNGSMKNNALQFSLQYVIK
jgi:hypothetical protein